MFTLVSPAVLDDWKRLAARVRDTLAEAGLPVATENEPDYFAGVTVDVDPGDDEAGGVFVLWRPHRRLGNAVAESVTEQRIDDPVLRHFGAIAEAMRQAAWSILDSAGFTVADPNTDYRPLQLQVLAGPPE
ncbi:hypothetical protein BDK92_4832 [Micromonospora pisi]|uniref:DUF3168 domain-containing protein n=1 Tax=Micromonospora pisi TaxID=589240 RepID=A0A495JQX1_9ACTN|nr:hypothetical protein [Micromonospora pisi]RKR90459.1 hypothetical protein BDK92_4832 [Micromonospora pisi]